VGGGRGGGDGGDGDGVEGRGHGAFDALTGEGG
jgi:hypothetical protein